jgi:predicted transcriptional regulator
MWSTHKSLGELEHAVMRILWMHSPLAVRDVLARLGRKPAPAYTTVMTVLDRLNAKGVVERMKGGKAFLYRPRLTQEQWTAQNALLALGREPTNGVLMAFLDSAEQADPQLMVRLRQLIAARRERDR